MLTELKKSCAPWIIQGNYCSYNSGGSGNTEDLTALTNRITALEEYRQSNETSVTANTTSIQSIIENTSHEAVDYSDRLRDGLTVVQNDNIGVVMHRFGKLRVFMARFTGTTTSADRILTTMDEDKPSKKLDTFYQRTNTSIGRLEILTDGQVRLRTSDTSTKTIYATWFVE